MHRNILLARGLAIAALAISLGGCAPPQFDVTGQVKYNGAPLAKPDGQIVFVGADGTQASATIALDGTYTAKVSAGLNRVAVYYPNPAFKKAVRPKGVPDPTKRPDTSQPQFLTPDKYASVETSKLQIEVAQGTVFNPDLKGPAIP